jgi:hypothetical protein
MAPVGRIASSRTEGQSMSQVTLPLEKSCRAWPGLHLLVVLGWLAAIGYAFFWLCQYEATPGKHGAAPSDWPAGGPLRLDPDRFTLVLALHSRCPCSRATVQELADILTRHPSQVVVAVLLYCPEPEGAGSDDNHLNLRVLPAGIRVERANCGEARRFGAATSGHVLLYRPDGRLVFSGGITRGRGQVGDSPGRAALCARLRGVCESLASTAVYGCPLEVAVQPERIESSRNKED